MSNNQNTIIIEKIIEDFFEEHGREISDEELKEAINGWE